MILSVERQQSRAASLGISSLLDNALQAKLDPDLPAAVGADSQHVVDVEIFVAEGQLTIIKKLKGAARGMLRQVQRDDSMTDEESRQSAIQ